MASQSFKIATVIFEHMDGRGIAGVNKKYTPSIVPNSYPCAANNWPFFALGLYWLGRMT